MDKTRNTSPEARTNDLIQRLSAQPSKGPVLRGTHFVRYWGLGAILVITLSLWLLPTREDLHERLFKFDAPILFSLWLLAFLLPALRVFSLAYPDGRLPKNLSNLSRWALAPIVGLAVFSLIRFRYDDFQFQLYRESSPFNGGCGMVIFVAGFIQAAFLFSWIRKGATTSPRAAGAWAALSSASFASFLVQFACANENPIHVLIWHFIPLLLLTLIAAATGRRIFRW